MAIDAEEIVNKVANRMKEISQLQIELIEDIKKNDGKDSNAIRIYEIVAAIYGSVHDVLKDELKRAKKGTI